MVSENDPLGFVPDFLATAVFRHVVVIIAVIEAIAQDNHQRRISPVVSAPASVSALVQDTSNANQRAVQCRLVKRAQLKKPKL